MNFMKYQDFLKSESSCPCKESWVLIGSSSRTLIQNIHPNPHKNSNEHKIKLLPWPSQSPDVNLWAELKMRVHKTGSWMIWRNYVKRNGLRFLSLYSTTLLDVTGEDSMLFYWQREVVQSIRCRGVNNWHTWFC